MRPIGSRRNSSACPRTGNPPARPGIAAPRSELAAFIVRLVSLGTSVCAGIDPLRHKLVRARSLDHAARNEPLIRLAHRVSDRGGVIAKLALRLAAVGPPLHSKEPHCRRGEQLSP